MASLIFHIFWTYYGPQVSAEVKLFFILVFFNGMESYSYFPCAKSDDSFQREGS